MTGINNLNSSSVLSLIYFELECSCSGLHNLFYLVESIWSITSWTQHSKYHATRTSLDSDTFSLHALILGQNTLIFYSSEKCLQDLVQLLSFLLNLLPWKFICRLTVAFITMFLFRSWLDWKLLKGTAFDLVILLCPVLSANALLHIHRRMGKW